MYCWKVAIAVYVNATKYEYRLKKDVTNFKNMGHFSPEFVRPGRLGLILGVSGFSLKSESFRPWVVYVLSRFSSVSIGRVRE